ncbi:RNase adapter RapZ [Pseudopelagicola sp. nBUS_19]|uniref:RNase adapter RapZ n=1 Tax=unclassified Pseudopelagicola TaxID=2649563 RepID=UPI003EB86BE8
MSQEDIISKNQVVLITGPSGAGRSTAIHALEDSGYQTIDNLPIGLVERLFSGLPLDRPIAVGLDARNRDFSASAFLDVLNILDRLLEMTPKLLYLDCRIEVLERRYNETGRRHPMAPDESPREGIRRDLEMLDVVRARADLLIDTSSLSPHDLRAIINRRFVFEIQKSMSITIQSFAYKRAMPEGVHLVFDCRFLQNPHWVAGLRPLNGTKAAVGEYISRDESYPAFMAKLEIMLDLLLPAYASEGRSNLVIAFGCTGGKHRSVFVAESLAKSLAYRGLQVSIRHCELNRFAILPARTSDGSAGGDKLA